MSSMNGPPYLEIVTIILTYHIQNIMIITTKLITIFHQHQNLPTTLNQKLLPSHINIIYQIPPPPVRTVIIL